MIKTLKQAEPYKAPQSKVLSIVVRKVIASSVLSGGSGMVVDGEENWDEVE